MALQTFIKKWNAKMRFDFPKYMGAALMILAVSSCKKDKPQPVIPDPADKLAIYVFPTYGTQTLYLDSTYQTQEGYDVQFTDIKFFAGSWKNGTETLVDAALFDFREKGNVLFEISKKPDAFGAIQGYLGIEPAVNHSDPTAFPNDNVLNITNAGGMHWGWNPGYIFIKVEARVDTIPDGIPLFDHLVVLHVGTDDFLQTLDFPSVTWQNSGLNSYFASMELNMSQFLSNGTQSIDLKTEHTTHSGAGQEALSLKAIQNFKAALSFE